MESLLFIARAHRNKGNYAMNLLDTLPGSLMDGFLPRGWDLAKIDRLASLGPADFVRRERWWHPEFQPVACESFSDFDTYLGHEIAREIQLARRDGRPLALILPVGPMGMYRWTVYFLGEWDVPCEHVHGFNMDEWSDGQGNTLPSDNPGAFQYAMEQALYAPLGKRTVPPKQRHFARKDELPTYKQQIADLKKQGARLVTVFGIGRVCHIAFWEPHFAEEFPGPQEWKKETHRLARACTRSPSSKTRSPASVAAQRSFPRSRTPSARACSWLRIGSSAALTAPSTAACSGRACRCE